MKFKAHPVSAVAPLGLAVAGFWLCQPIAGQNRVNISDSVRKAAAALLDSPTAEYVSGAGLTALGVLSGRTRPVPAVPAGVATAVGVPFSTNPLVNDPSKDLLSFADISTQSETSGAGHQNVAIVAYNDSGDFVISGSFTGYSRSANAGETFVDMGPIPPSPMGLLLGDPSAAANRAGHFFVASLAFDLSQPPGFEQTIAISRSTDTGLTFAPPVYIPGAALQPFGFPDKEMLTVDNTRGWFDGNIYVTYTAFQPLGGPTVGAPIAFSRSTDRGLSFSRPIPISNPGELNQGSEPAVARDGTIYVAWYRFAPGPPAILVARSTDGGLSFSPPVVAAPVSPIGFGAGTFGGNLKGNFRVNMFPRIDVSAEAVLVVFNSNPAAAEDGADVYIVRSTDRGATWTPPLRLNNDRSSADQFFPDVAVTQNGEVRVIWYDTRNSRSITDVMIDVYSAMSRDGGKTFGPNERITDQSFPPAVGYDPVTSRTYMGDYIDIKTSLGPAGIGNNMLLDWGDNRRVVVTLGGVRHDQDVAFARRASLGER
jgi:hypothetical protein